MKKIILLLLFPILLSVNMSATTTLEVGQSVNLYCTATPPEGGWFDQVIFTLVDPNDAQYLSITNNKPDQSAVLTGRAAKSSIKLEVVCSYSYLGSYDKKIHVGHFSYYEYVTVTGGVSPTSVTISAPSTMEVGETISLYATLSPSNASAVFSWGFVSGLGQPYNFNLTYIGGEAMLYARKEGTAYVVVETDNGKSNMVTITAISSSITKIEFQEETMSIGEGMDLKLNVSYSPSKSSPDNIAWSSSDPSIISVSSDGTIHGVAPGEAIITASSKSDSSVKAICKVKCLPAFKFEEGEYKKISGIQAVYHVGERIVVSDDASLVWSLDGEIIKKVSSPLVAGEHILRLVRTSNGKIAHSMVYTIKVEE